MKLVGIIQWYNGEYGIIDCCLASMPDVAFLAQEMFFHHTQLLCSRESVSKGSVVVFSTRHNPRKDRDEASSIDVLTNTSDSEIITLCMGSQDTRIWSEVIPLFPSVTSIEQAIKVFEQKIETLSADQRSQQARKIPAAILRLSTKLRDFLTAEDRFYTLTLLSDEAPLLPFWADEMAVLLRQVNPSVLENVIKSKPNEYLRDLISTEAQRRVRRERKTPLWHLLTNDQLASNNTLELAPTWRRLQFFAEMMTCSEGKSRQEYVLKFNAILKKVSSQERDYLIDRLPHSVLKEADVFSRLPHHVMVRIIWDDLLNGDTEVWNSLSNIARVFCVYRAVKERITLSLPSPSEVQHPFVRAALTLYSISSVGRDPQDAFMEAHQFLEDYVLKVAWESTERLLLPPLLPPCIPGLVAYCEAQPRVINDESNLYAWCPCAGTRCHATSAGVILQRPEDYTKNRNIPLKDREPLQGARADTYQIWQNWRLLELLEALAIRPELEGLRDYDGRILVSLCRD